MPDPNRPSYVSQLKTIIAYEENQVVNSEEDSPGACHHRLNRGGNSRRPGQCALK